MLAKEAFKPNDSTQLQMQRAPLEMSKLLPTKSVKKKQSKYSIQTNVFLYFDQSS